MLEGNGTGNLGRGMLEYVELEGVMNKANDGVVDPIVPLLWACGQPIRGVNPEIYPCTYTTTGPLPVR